MSALLESATHQRKEETSATIHEGGVQTDRRQGWLHTYSSYCYQNISAGVVEMEMMGSGNMRTMKDDEKIKLPENSMSLLVVASENSKITQCRR